MAKVRMKLKEFVDTYCKDIKATFSSAVKDVFAGSDFTYDAIRYDEELGTHEKVIIVNDVDIPLQDIFGYSFEDFSKIYPDPEAQKAQKLYLENFEIISGEDLLNEVQRQAAEQLKRIDAFSSLDLSTL